MTNRKSPKKTKKKKFVVKCNYYFGHKRYVKPNLCNANTIYWIANADHKRNYVYYEVRT